jgi:hypothetical protein
MARRKPAPQSGRRLMAVAGLLLLIGAALFASFRRPHAPVSANVVATAVTFEYHPIEAEPTGGPEVPLLAGAPLQELAVRSFESLTAASGILSLREADDQPWKGVQGSGPIVIRGNGDSAQAIFPGVTIERWGFGGHPTVSLEFPGGQPILRALVEGKGIDLFFDAGESIEFECQLCRIDGLDQEGVARVRQVRLSGLNQVALKASSRSIMVLNATPPPSGFGGQRFRLSDVRFCGGKGREPESTVVSGSVTFPETGDVHTLAGPAGANSSFLRLTAEASFVVTSLRVVDVKGRSALDLQFDGLAHSAEMPPACDARAAQFQPSYFDVLSHKPVIKGASGALAILLLWLGFFDTFQNLWTRIRGK